MAAPRQDLDLYACRRCGLVWNAATSPGGVTAPGPDPTPVPDGVVERLAATYDLHDRLVVSLSGRDAGFLGALGARSGARAVVLDSEYRVPGPPTRVPLCEDDPDRLREVPRLIVLRGLLEHLGDPVGLLRRARGMAGSGTTIYVEVPDASTLYAETALWRLASGQCVHFTAASLAVALRAGGLTVARLTSDRGRLYAEATRAAVVPTTPPPDPRADVAAIARFTVLAQRRLDHWRQQLSELVCGDTTVALWGIHGPGRAVLMMVPPARGLRLLVDPDPRRQGRYPAGGTGPIRSPLALRAQPPDVLLTAEAGELAAARGLLASLDLHRPCRPLVGPGLLTGSRSSSQRH